MLQTLVYFRSTENWGTGLMSVNNINTSTVRNHFSNEKPEAAAFFVRRDNPMA